MNARCLFHAKFLQTILVLLVTTNLFSQPVSETKKSGAAKNVYAELLGNGLMLSLNYDFRFAQQQNGWGMRLGAGYFDGGTGNGVLTVPVAVNYLAGNSSSFLELSMGATFATFDDDYRSFYFYYPSKLLLVPGIGYRYQPMGKGFTGRLAFSTLIATNGKAIPFGGLSVGYKW